jgi:hypothetical protein
MKKTLTGEVKLHLKAHQRRRNVNLIDIAPSFFASPSFSFGAGGFH